MICSVIWDRVVNFLFPVGKLWWLLEFVAACGYSASGDPV